MALRLGSAGHHDAVLSVLLDPSCEQPLLLLFCCGVNVKENSGEGSEPIDGFLSLYACLRWEQVL